jgi:hypothetical protein
VQLYQLISTETAVHLASTLSSDSWITLRAPLLTSRTWDTGCMQFINRQSFTSVPEMEWRIDNDRPIGGDRPTVSREMH